MKNEIIFTGVVKKKPNCGVSMKNMHFINRFREIYDKVWIVGIKKSHTNLYLLPFQILLLIFIAILRPKARIVISSNSWESNIIISILNFLGMSQRTYFWVAGGLFHTFVGKQYPVKRFNRLKSIYVQSPKMVNAMKEKGFDNVRFVPNSKRINYMPSIPNRIKTKIYFVFLSRIHPDKGCDLIIESAKNLNKRGFQDKFCVDFWGTPLPEYKNAFLNSIESLDNVKYHGNLDLTKESCYDTLAEYDVMLFPTYWHGEGFPGVVIDASIAGIPIIASDWNFNADVINEEMGVIIPHHNQVRVEEEMLNFILGKYDIRAMRQRCQAMAKEYDDRRVLSVDNLKRIGML